MSKRYGLAALLFLLAACGSSPPRPPTEEEQQFVTMLSPYCGPALTGFGYRTCNAYLVLGNGHVDLLAGIDMYGNPITAGRNAMNEVRAGISMRDFYASDKLARIVGPRDADYPALTDRYLTQSVQSPRGS